MLGRTVPVKIEMKIDVVSICTLETDILEVPCNDIGIKVSHQNSTVMKTGVSQ